MGCPSYLAVCAQTTCAQASNDMAKYRAKLRHTLPIINERGARFSVQRRTSVRRERARTHNMSSLTRRGTGPLWKVACRDLRRIQVFDLGEAQRHQLGGERIRLEVTHPGLPNPN